MRHAQYILAGIVIAGAVGFLAMLALHETPAANKDALMMALGAVMSAFGTIIGYFFGSSKGSADKTAALIQKPADDPNQLKLPINP